MNKPWPKPEFDNVATPTQVRFLILRDTAESLADCCADLEARVGELIGGIDTETERIDECRKRLAALEQADAPTATEPRDAPESASKPPIACQCPACVAIRGSSNSPAPIGVQADAPELPKHSLPWRRRCMINDQWEILDATGCQVTHALWKYAAEAVVTAANALGAHYERRIASVEGERNHLYSENEDLKARVAEVEKEREDLISRIDLLQVVGDRRREQFISRVAQLVAELDAAEARVAELEQQCEAEYARGLRGGNECAFPNKPSQDDATPAPPQEPAPIRVLRNATCWQYSPPERQWMALRPALQAAVELAEAVQLWREDPRRGARLQTVDSYTAMLAAHECVMGEKAADA